MIDPAEHLGLVRFVAAQLARTMARRPDPTELWGDGYLGLASAARRYDPSRGTTFSTFAVPRIAGAIHDGERDRRGWRRTTPGRRRLCAALSLEDLQAARSPLVPRDPANVSTRLEHDETARLVRASVLLLPVTERTVLSMHYFDDLLLREIGQVFGVSESRISQIRRKALERLRRRLERAIWPGSGSGRWP